ncbi:MAG TPA: hypothetical protein VFP87_08125 [Chitinophagaceae bacterium]|nr:hypothetical protein [Chitinophagaceae bacterium]
MGRIICSLCLFISTALPAQPYIDIARFNYSYSPEWELGKKENALESHFFNINVTLPLELKKGGDAFVINPFFEHNQGEVSGNDFHAVSQGLLVGFLKKEVFPDWNIMSSFILRRNKQAEKHVPDEWQYGGLILATWKKDQSASLKFGIYYNKEFFGNYFMPLLGIDWRINEKNNLFGVLPGNMWYEHKVNKKFFYGSAFRALTNSYRLETIDPCASGDCSAKNYLRVDDNQLGLFADWYFTKRLVVTGESGYTIFRRYRYGFKGDDVHIKINYKNDNFYFRASVSYRVRFR